jgi:RimJ/RimL family protein N-acetyltransferase
MVLRIRPDNPSSLRTAEKSGFTRTGVVQHAEGPMIHFVRDI